MEGFDQLNVFEKRDLRLLKFLEDFVFKSLEFVLTRLNLVDELVFVLLNCGLFHLDDDSETLFLETLLLDREVDHVDLG